MGYSFKEPVLSAEVRVITVMVGLLNSRNLGSQISSVAPRPGLTYTLVPPTVVKPMTEL